jgi:hypothetical protein
MAVGFFPEIAGDQKIQTERRPGPPASVFNNGIDVKFSAEGTKKNCAVMPATRGTPRHFSVALIFPSAT